MSVRTLDHLDIQDTLNNELKHLELCYLLIIAPYSNYVNKLSECDILVQKKLHPYQRSIAINQYGNRGETSC